MGTRERRDRQRSELRSLIIDTARRLFAAEGYYAVSMRRIADAIEYSPTAIYVHFKDKQSLIRELCTQDFAALARRFMELAHEKDPIERIRTLGHLYIRFAVEHPNHYRLMFMTPLDPAFKASVDADWREPDEQMCHGNPEHDAYQFLFQSVKEALLARRFAPKFKDARVVAQTFWAAVHGVASLQITMGDDASIDWADLKDRADAAIEATIRGLDRPRRAMNRHPRAKAGAR